ncbi:MAG: hypothetical protein H0X72_12235 [Acidobacteria bacterium]|nr:hypothetical protein [Acidobacteriota bacterium]
MTAQPKKRKSTPAEYLALEEKPKPEASIGTAKSSQWLAAILTISKLWAIFHEF